MKKSIIKIFIFFSTTYCDAQVIDNVLFINDSLISVLGKTDSFAFNLEFNKLNDSNWEINSKKTLDLDISKINIYTFKFNENNEITELKASFYNDSFEIIVKLYSNRIIKEKGYYFINKITSNLKDKIQIGIPVTVSVSDEYIKDNYWKYYNELGVLFKEELWDKGNLLSTKSY